VTGNEGHTVSVYGCLALICLSDIMPFIIQLTCMWIGAKHKHENLAIEKLNKEIPIARGEDLTTDAGSNMLEGLREEFKNNGIESCYLDSDVIPTE